MHLFLFSAFLAAEGANPVTNNCAAVLVAFVLPVSAATTASVAGFSTNVAAASTTPFTTVWISVFIKADL